MADVANGRFGAYGGTSAALAEVCAHFDPPNDLAFTKDLYRIENDKFSNVQDAKLSQTENVTGEFFSIADMSIWRWASL